MYAIVKQWWTPQGWQSTTLNTHEAVFDAHDSLRREVNIFLQAHPTAACRTLSPYQEDMVERFGIIDDKTGEMYQFLNIKTS